MAEKTWSALFKRLTGRRPAIVSVIRLTGVIGPAGRYARTLDLQGLAPQLERAFDGKRVKAVALAINSPGGSAAQSMLVFQRIRALAVEKGVPVFAFAEDAAASGGYMLACAADEIFATEGSIVGSIGVIAATFGFEKAIERLGVERRLYTAGARKSLLDPFLPVADDEVRRLRAVQEDLHEAFKDLVRLRRGSRLKGDEGELFSGEFWTGRRALSLGLVDGIADLRSEMRRRFGEDVVLRVVEPERRFFARASGLFGGASTPAGRRTQPAFLLDDALSALEARAFWARLGL